MNLLIIFILFILLNLELEKSKNESFEKLEKFRKISEDLIKDVPTEETTSKTEVNILRYINFLVLNRKLLRYHFFKMLF